MGLDIGVCWHVPGNPQGFQSPQIEKAAQKPHNKVNTFIRIKEHERPQLNRFGNTDLHQQKLAGLIIIHPITHRVEGKPMKVRHESKEHAEVGRIREIHV